MALFALIGYPLENTFSQDYFNQLFKASNLPHKYINFAIPELKEINKWIVSKPSLRGLNVTRPYKEQIIPYLHELSEEAQLCGAVNCIKIDSKGKRKGYNTDVYGFKTSLEKLLNGVLPKKALILGNGGAAKAVKAALKQLQIEFLTAARTPRNPQEIALHHLTFGHFVECKLIINTTPLGMHPDLNEKVEIPYEAITPGHFCFDLIYLPETTKFLAEAQKHGAKTKNGLEMLHLQANKAWEIWQEE
jgi:shikimate dehydrogenase